MNPCLHPSILTEMDFNSYLQLAKSTGYRFIDVNEAWLSETEREKGLPYLRNQFFDAGVQLASFGLPVDLFASDEVFARQLKELPARAERNASLGATRCCTWLMPSIDELPVPYAGRLASRLRDCANALSAFGVRLGLEFVGPHHLRTNQYPFIYNLDHLLAFIDGIGAPNVGILLDSYHVYTAEMNMDELLALHAHQIVHVHINDATLPPHEAHDGRRVLPLDGQIDLQAFVTALDRIGYTGPLSVEVLHQEPLSGTNEEIALTVFQRLTQLIETARKGTFEHA